MADRSIGFDAMMDLAESPAWKQLMDKGEAAAPVQTGLDPGAYLRVFGTPEGEAVLADLYNRYVNVTRAVPGQGAEAAFYREGMAQVVFDIVHQINKAQGGTR